MLKFTPKPRPKADKVKMNAMYEQWQESKSQYDYDDLMTAILNTVYGHYLKHGIDTADDISAEAASRVSRALPGYLGPSPLRQYDHELSKGQFYSYVAMVARAANRDFFKRLSPSTCGDDNLTFRGEDWELEGYQNALDDPWQADGKGWTKKTKDPDTITDPLSKATFGESCIAYDEDILD